MWRFLSPLASPKWFYTRAFAWSKWFAVFSMIFLALGLIGGLYVAPPDYQQGDAFRIIYIHVPAAFLSMMLYAMMGGLSFSLLVWRIKLAGVFIRAIAPVGASMALLALITGSLWGKPMWGAYWVWDARLTSEFVLLLLYFAILVVSETYSSEALGDRLVAILSLVGLIDLPIIHYSVYWWNTLHQGATLTVLSKPKIHTSMLYPLLSMLLGFLCFALCIVLSKSRQMILLREKKSNWVLKLFQKGEI